jgi:anti-sigma regulatory factor (Ser/Thr protein kinase)
MVTTARAADLTVDLPRSNTAPAIARRALRRFLADADAYDLLGDAELAMSELVANAVVHASGHVALAIWWTAETGVLRVEVADGDPNPPVARTTSSPARGRGLHIVAAITSQWGVIEDGRAPGGNGKVVWFEIHSFRAGRRTA